MSLFILLDPLIESEEFKVHCVFYMAVMAFFTVLINGTTAKYVLEGLGLLKMTPQQLDVLQYVLKVRLEGGVWQIGWCVVELVHAVAIAGLRLVLIMLIAAKAALLHLLGTPARKFCQASDKGRFSDRFCQCCLAPARPAVSQIVHSTL